MRKAIIFLLSKRLGVKIYQPFRFANQKSETEYYYFTWRGIAKVTDGGRVAFSKVSLNWLLNDECKLIPIKKE